MSSRIRALFNSSRGEKRSSIAVQFCNTFYIGSQTPVSDFPLIWLLRPLHTSPRRLQRRVGGVEGKEEKGDSEGRGEVEKEGGKTK
jgi:hypothetical protein